MTSTISWLDFSETDRRKAMEVIKLFQDKSTVDELGIGTVRDAISDILFPGSSVIHSRARYFLFIPWIYKALEEKKTPSAEVAGKARTAELNLMEVLRDSEDSAGTIGVRAGRTLKILPSAIYWQALTRLGIRKFPGTRDQYHRSLDRFYVNPARLLDDDGERVAGGRRTNWDQRIPAAPARFPAGVSMKLRKSEAAYLRDRIRHSAAGSLYAELLDADRPPEPSAAPWEYERLDQLPARLQEQLHHAQMFAEVIAGAPLLYNRMLSEEAGNEEWATGFGERLADWSEDSASSHREIVAWDRNAFWRLVSLQGAKIPLQTRLFVERWLDLVVTTRGKCILENATARTLVTDRERQLKRSQARLGNKRAVDMWLGDSGTRPLTYRWNIVLITLNDIFEGLAAPSDA